MKKIKLTQNKYALVDDEDYENLNKYKWCVSTLGYAVRAKIINDKKRIEWMHRVINKTPLGMDTDHINGNKLDNQKINLRSVTRSQNCINKPLMKNNTSGFKGVYIGKAIYNGKTFKYIFSQIQTDGKTIYLGTFKTIQDAAKAYYNAAKKYHNQFRREA